MDKIKVWIQASRLRTLPLSVSGIILGSSLAILQVTQFSWGIFVVAILTTTALQILSNFANDYGDGVKGTDSKDRSGPPRALQLGIISPKEMLKGIRVVIVIIISLAVYLIYLSFGLDNLSYALIFLFMTVLSIIAALKYTMGKNPYGYRGFGDVFVFLFFGILSVCGTYFLYTHTLDFKIFLPGVALGALSTAVLNLNNLRDCISDKKSNKITLVVRLGEQASKKYHYYLLTTAFISSFIYTLDNYFSLLQWLYLIAFIPIFMHCIKVFKNKDTRLLDSELRKLVLSTFLYSILFGLGNIII